MAPAVAALRDLSWPLARQRLNSLVAAIDRDGGTRARRGGAGRIGLAKCDVELTESAALRIRNNRHVHRDFVRSARNPFDTPSQRGVVNVRLGRCPLGPPSEADIAVDTAEASYHDARSRLAPGHIVGRGGKLHAR